MKNGVDAARQRVAQLLQHVPLLDGHNDLAYVIRHDPVAKGDVDAFGLDQRRPSGDTDIPRLRAGLVSAQVWAAFVPSEFPVPVIETLEQIDVVLRVQEAFPEVFHPILKSSDIDEAKRLGKIGSLLAVEGAIGMQDSLSPLRVWYAAGVRLVTLCHNGSLPWVDSATDAPRSHGLSSFGETVVREMNRLGIIIDCAHVSDEAIHRVLDISEAPIAFSHSNARILCNHPRNLPDDILTRVPANDGIVMAAFLPKFISEDVRRWMDVVRAQAGIGLTLPIDWAARVKAYEKEHGEGPKAHLRQVADHIEYLADKVGVSRVGIGSDFWGGPDTPVGLSDVSCFPDLLVELALRGWSDEDLAGVAGANFVRVFAAVEEKGAELRRSRRPVVINSLGKPQLLANANDPAA